MFGRSVAGPRTAAMGHGEGAPPSPTLPPVLLQAMTPGPQPGVGADQKSLGTTVVGIVQTHRHTWSPVQWRLQFKGQSHLQVQRHSCMDHIDINGCSDVHRDLQDWGLV